MTDEQIAAIAARLAAITPGRWYARLTPLVGTFVYSTDDICYDRQVCAVGGYDGVQVTHNAEDDADFIANAPDDIAYLLKRVKTLEAAMREVISLDDYMSAGMPTTAEDRVVQRTLNAAVGILRRALEGD